VPLSVYDSVPVFETLVASALQVRPEIKQAEARGDAVRLMGKKAKWGPLVPSVAANYSYGEFEGDGRGFASESDDRTDYSVAIFWELDGLGFSNRAYSVKQASVYRQARAAEAQARADVSSEVKQALDAIVHSERQFKVLTRAVERARRAYELTRDRVFENHGEPLDALQSMRMLEDAEKMMVRATARYNLAQLRLLTVAGGVVDAAAVQ
jgi:outer membrane protein TolC